MNFLSNGITHGEPRIFLSEDNHDVGNWDAAWVFAKYKLDNGEWQHIKLLENTHEFEMQYPNATIKFGKVSEIDLYNPESNPYVGAFIYRNQEGVGTFNLDRVQLLWDTMSLLIDDESKIDIKVYGIEMVYIPPGSFYLGSGGSGPREFHQVIPDRLEYPPFFMTENWNRRFSMFSGSTLGQRQTLGAGGIIDPLFPTGVDGFYGMKYELSQQQYSEFLQTLTRYQFDRRYNSLGQRNFIRSNRQWEPIYVAATNLNWIDLAAYLDWSGLRPMTEFEFEKAARGPVYPVPNEYAWGTDTIAMDAYEYEYLNTKFESISQNYQVDEVTGNAIYESTQSIGPLRVGTFATSESNRVSAGAGYYGMLDLSGNAYEFVVAVELETGRLYQCNHGDGSISFGGEANESSWPGLRGGIVLDGVGSGLRGGSFKTHPSLLRISYRDGLMGVGSDSRTDGLGGRGVRSLPTQGDKNLKRAYK